VEPISPDFVQYKVDDLFHQLVSENVLIVTFETTIVTLFYFCM